MMNLSFLKKTYIKCLPFVLIFAVFSFSTTIHTLPPDSDLAKRSNPDSVRAIVCNHYDELQTIYLKYHSSKSIKTDSFRITISINDSGIIHNVGICKMDYIAAGESASQDKNAPHNTVPSTMEEMIAMLPDSGESNRSHVKRDSTYKSNPYKFRTDSLFLTELKGNIASWQFPKIKNIEIIVPIFLSTVHRKCNLLKK